MLLAPTLLGHAHLGGVTVRDGQGRPVKMCADPLATDDERELIAAELARVQAGPRERRQSAALVGVIFCWFCESALSSTIHKRNGRVYQYYRCHTNRCTSIPAEAAEERAEEELLRTLGDEDITERVWMRGDSNETELRTALAAFEELSAAAGKMTSRTAKDRLQRQLAALDARIAELESMPAREGRYEYRPTGETYREAWEKNADPDARRDLLKRVGVDIRMGIIDGHLHVHPVALGDRLPLPEWAQVDENSSPEQIQRWQKGAAAERRKWGVPNLE